MSGRHAAPGRGRLISEILRMIPIVLLGLAAVFFAAMWVTNLLSPDGEPVPLGSTTSTTAGATAASSTATSTATSEGSTSSVASTTTPDTSTTTTTEPTTTTSSTTTSTTQPTTTTTTIAAPASINVLVLNSTRRNGLAGRVSDKLAELGYTMLEPANHPEALETSRVWYAPGFEAEAGVLAEAIPDAIVEPFSGDDPEADIVVVLGASYTE